MMLDLNPCCPEPPKFVLPPTRVLGSDITLPLQVNSRLTGLPVPIGAATEIVAILLKADGTFLEEKLSLGGVFIIDGDAGQANILIAAADSALLAPSPVYVPAVPPAPFVPPVFSSVELHITLAGKTSIVNLPNSINLVSRLFPTAP
jgi:hypothetical protein